MRAAWVAVAVGCLLASGAADDKKAKIKEATERIERVRVATDIRAPGSTPFRLRAWLQMADWLGGRCEGTYSLVWISPEQWQEHTKCGGFEELRMVRIDTEWVRREPGFLPDNLLQLRRVLSFRRSIQLRKSEEVKKILPQDKSRPSMECIELGQKYSPGWQMCFERNPDRLVRRIIPGSELFPTRTLALGDYGTLSEKIFPRKIWYFEGPKKVIEITIEELAEATPSSALLLAPPDGATTWPWCAEPILAGAPIDLVKDFDPSPNLFGDSYRWRLVVYAVVGADGKATNIRVLQNDRPDLEQHAIKVMQRNRFTPAKCNGVAIKSERTFNFPLFTRVAP